MVAAPCAAGHRLAWASVQAAAARRGGDTTGEWVTMSGGATGRPPAEPVLRVESREELVFLLGQACEIEHGLMCEYLYAQFSLKRGLDEGLTEAQLARVHSMGQDIGAHIPRTSATPQRHG